MLWTGIREIRNLLVQSHAAAKDPLGQFSAVRRTSGRKSSIPRASQCPSSSQFLRKLGFAFHDRAPLR